MRYILFAVFMALFSIGTAIACDDHIGKCEIEAWRYTHTPMMRMLTIEGSATCNNGSANIRLFQDGKFLGVAKGIIEGHALSAMAMAIYEKPKSLKIKYSIEVTNGK